MRTLLLGGAATLALLIQTGALAGDESHSAAGKPGSAGGDLAVELSAQRILPAATPGAAERRESAARAKPGELIEYRATYTNAGQSPARQVRATLPLPAAGVYVADSASPAGVEASTDGRHFARPPLQRWVVKPDGRREQQAVPVAEYRFLRWPLGDLAPGQSLAVAARLRVANAGNTENPQ